MAFGTKQSKQKFYKVMWRVTFQGSRSPCPPLLYGRTRDANIFPVATSIHVYGMLIPFDLDECWRAISCGSYTLLVSRLPPHCDKYSESTFRGCWGPAPLRWGVSDPCRNTPFPTSVTTASLVVLGQTGCVITEIPGKLWPFTSFAFQGHWNPHGSTGYLWLPITVP